MWSILIKEMLHKKDLVYSSRPRRAYQLRGTSMVTTNIYFMRDPWRLKLQYTALFGKFAPGLGWFRDRDMLFFQAAYLF